jgi:hypothetical protein
MQESNTAVPATSVLFLPLSSPYTETTLTTFFVNSMARRLVFPLNARPRRFRPGWTCVLEGDTACDVRPLVLSTPSMCRTSVVDLSLFSTFAFFPVDRFCEGQSFAPT